MVGSRRFVPWIQRSSAIIGVIVPLQTGLLK